MTTFIDELINEADRAFKAVSHYSDYDLAISRLHATIKVFIDDELGSVVNGVCQEIIPYDDLNAVASDVLGILLGESVYVQIVNGIKSRDGRQRTQEEWDNYEHIAAEQKVILARRIRKLPIDMQTPTKKYYLAENPINKDTQYGTHDS